ncbi:condensation domain-containing protein [Candidatus Bipolaricaulota bacterium]
MSIGNSPQRYERRITPIERLFTRSPFSIVTMVVRIRGHVTEAMLRDALAKVNRRHPNLRVRIVEDDTCNPWFTSEGVESIPVEVAPRESDDQWIEVLEKTSQVPFEFDERPPIRFILLASPDKADLVIVSHHIICDGLSLAYLARDLMVHLGDPSRELDVLPDPVLVDRDTIPGELALNPVVKAVLRRINKKWYQERVIFDQEDYRELTAAYWRDFQHSTLPVELTEAQTSDLVARCRAESVTVNTALTAAFVEAQILVQGMKPFHSSIGIGVSLRDRLRGPAGEAMGFYAGVLTLKYNHFRKSSFWENARRLHRRIKPLLRRQGMLKDPLTWCHLDPTILEAMNFKKLGGLVSPDATRHKKLTSFAKREDVVQGMLKRGRMDSLDRIFMGTAVTNLTRLDFPRQYGELELDRLILQPGGAFPLSQVGLVVGAVTCSGKLSLVLEYAEEAAGASTMRRVSEKALELLEVV